MTVANETFKITKKKKPKLNVVETPKTKVKKKIKIINAETGKNKSLKLKILDNPEDNGEPTFKIKPKPKSKPKGNGKNKSKEKSKTGKKKILNIKLVEPENESEPVSKPKMNDFQIFVRDCKKGDYDYVKFHGKSKWVGPAVMLDNDSNITESDIRKSTTVNLDKETFGMCIVLYPSNYCDPLSIGYPDQDDFDDRILNSDSDNSKSEKVKPIDPIQEMLDMEEDEFEVVPWCHNGKKYNVNPVDNYIYDIDTDECLGKRVIDNNNWNYNIDFTDLDG
jgi:hypothetical protein